MEMNKVSPKHVVRITFGLIVVIVLGLGLLSINQMLRLSRVTTSLYNHPLTVSRALLKIESDINAMHRSMKDVATSTSEETRKSALALVDDLEQAAFGNFNTVSQRFLGSPVEVEVAETLFREWREIRTKVVLLSGSGESEQALSITRGEGAVHVAKLHHSLAPLIAFAEHKADEFMEVSAREKRTTLILMVAVILLFAIASILVLRTMIRVLDEAHLVTKRQNVASKTINRFFSESIQEEDSNKVALSCLAIALEATESEYGFVVEEISEEQFQLLCVHDLTGSRDQVSHEDVGRLISLDELKDLFIMEDGLILNECPTLRATKGFPQGHPVINNLLSIPFDYRSTNGLMLVSNRKSHYDDFHLQLAKSLAMALGETLYSTRAQEELSQAEHYMQSVLNASPALICVADINQGQFIDANQATESILGYTKEELTSRPLIEFIKPEDRDRTNHEIEEQLKGADVANFENRYIHKEGRDVWISWQATAADANGLVYAVGSDITELKRIEAERLLMEGNLRQQQKLESIGTLAGGVAHEINNPINGIMNYSQLISERLDDDDPLKEFSDGIGKETKRVAEIVSNLLSFARQDRQSHSPADIQDIINDTVSLIGTIIKKDDITLNVDIPKDLPMIKCRSQQVQQIIMNLLTNARDAVNQKFPEHHEDKRIRLSVSPFDRDDRRWFRIAVEDHGSGVSDHVKERIFDPFFTTKDRTKGTGLGLAISIGIARDHHGDIKLERDQGVPTRFILELPVDNGWDLNKKA